MDEVSLINMLFSGSVALAGLVLIFLGGVQTAYDSFGAVNQGFVRSKYRKLAWLSLAGFISAILSALTALLWNWFESSALMNISLAAIIISFTVLVILSATSVLSIQ